MVNYSEILIAIYTRLTQGCLWCHSEWSWVITLVTKRNIQWHEISRGLSETAEPRPPGFSFPGNSLPLSFPSLSFPSLPSPPVPSPPLLFPSLPVFSLSPSLPGEPLLHYQLRGLGSAVSSHSGVRGGAPVANAFWASLRLRNVSGGSNFASLLCSANDKVHASFVRI